MAARGTVQLREKTTEETSRDSGSPMGIPGAERQLKNEESDCSSMEHSGEGGSGGAARAGGLCDMAALKHTERDEPSAMTAERERTSPRPRLTRCYRLVLRHFTPPRRDAVGRRRLCCSKGASAAGMLGARTKSARLTLIIHPGRWP